MNLFELALSSKKSVPEILSIQERIRLQESRTTEFEIRRGFYATATYYPSMDLLAGFTVQVSPLFQLLGVIQDPLYPGFIVSTIVEVKFSGENEELHPSEATMVGLAEKICYAFNIPYLGVAHTRQSVLGHGDKLFIDR